MGKGSKKKIKKVGVPPGTLLYTGDKTVEKINIEYFVYDEKECQVLNYNTSDINKLNAVDNKVVWINIFGLTDVGFIEKIGEKFKIHSLILEDILHTSQRPKMEEGEDYLFMVLKMIGAPNGGKRIEEEQVSLILKEGLVISFQEHIGDVFDIIRDRILSSKGKLRKKGTDYLFYSLLDTMVDNYFLILEEYDNRLEELNTDVLERPKPDLLDNLQKIRNGLNSMKRDLWPLRDAVGKLEKYESAMISNNTKLYIRDLYDHTLQIIDLMEGLRDSLGNIFELYMTSISNKMNEIMKTLTIIATIFIPLTFIAGIYGMNFEYMPELKFKMGYPILIIFMVFIFVGLIAFFRKKKWL
ncbi:magnesium/cobalt transporter CorA [uncultured Ilyobacter sp.]|uniref:magnesium/cobalt transporter CorA n=1 Tax=uncultured Ilyobacter sp. TaxID=544433 RepID=UPI0029C7ADD0|nr:magnesium/cobalt transporter CorA [uncultured Ilyobacter sp.]